MINSIKKIIPKKIKYFIKLNLLNELGPYNEYDDETKSIFIHIPKTGGVSVCEALYGEQIGHRKIKDLKLYDKNRFENYFKFAFVRNPWSRIVSAFHFLKQGGFNDRDKEWAEKKLHDINDFSKFVIKLNQDKSFRKIILEKNHFTPQTDYICINSKVEVDFIGKLENISKDFSIIKQKLNTKTELPHKNKSSHKDYSEYYNSRTKDIIGKIYKKDIEILNYKY